MSNDTHAIVQTIHRMGWLADTRHWDELIEVFTGTVHVDYTALTGGDPTDVTSHDLVAGWADSLGVLDATQHLVGSVITTVAETGSAATATAQFQATHLATIDGEQQTWTLGGHYLFALARDEDDDWRISAVTMTPTWSTGEDQLLARAATRSATTDEEDA